jgi:hypothetical protein
VCGNPNITKVLEITGVDQALPIYTTIEQATSRVALGEELAGSGGPAGKLRIGAGPRFEVHDIVSADNEGGSPV